MENKGKNLSQLLAYISMGFAALSIPFYFLGTFSVKLLEEKEYITLITFFKEASGNEEAKSVILTIAIFLVMSIVFSATSAVLNVFKMKTAKITGAVFSCITLVIDVAVIIRVCASANEDDLFSLIWNLNPDYGGIILLINVVIASVLSILSMVTFIKNGKAVTDDNGIFKVIPTDIIGGNDDTIMMNPNSQNSVVTDNRYNAGITFLSGCCAGFNVPINQNSIVIGKDPSQCSVIIDKSYASISRKHCEIGFDYSNNTYVVTDYSANGTFTENNIRINVGSQNRFPSGTILTLAKTDNILKLN